MQEQSEEFVKELINEVDGNGDGEIQYAEFKDMMNKIFSKIDK